MAIAYVNNVGYINGAAPQSSSPYTPGGGNSILAVISNRAGTGRTSSVTSTVGSYGLLSSANGLDSTTTFAFSSIAVPASAQTITANSTPTGDFVIMMPWEFSGVGSASAASPTTASSSSTTTNVISGAASPTVPVGSALFAVCIDTTRAIGNNAIADAAASSVYTNGFDTVGEVYTGAGASITPKFTPSAATATNYSIIQFLLSPTVVAALPFTQTKFFETQTVWQQ